MNGKAVRRLVASVMKLLEDTPPLVVLDVRDTGETQPAMSLVHALTRQQRIEQQVPLWVVSETEMPEDEGVSYFRELEEVFWKLEELRPRRRRLKKPEELLPDVEEISA
jgi:hypothetical protein